MSYGRGEAILTLVGAQVFGHVKSGFDIVKAMEAYGTQTGAPTANITVVVGTPLPSSRAGCCTVLEPAFITCFCTIGLQTLNSVPKGSVCKWSCKRPALDDMFNTPQGPSFARVSF